MTALEEIHQMPLHEKLRIMEAIWDDICREEQNLEVPQWHKDILDERERLVAEGKAQFVDWEDAKKQIDEATDRSLVIKGGFGLSEPLGLIFSGSPPEHRRHLLLPCRLFALAPTACSRQSAERRKGMRPHG